MYLILSVQSILSGSTKRPVEPNCRIEINGNWQDENGFKAGKQTREPELKENEERSFSQELKLAKGSCKILFEYGPVGLVFWL